MHIGAYSGYLTTEEAAAYLRLSERKLYEFVASGAIPCTKVTGRWLFPKTALDRWVLAGLVTPSAMARVSAPAIVGGSHDPLLEWALRESGCGLAYLAEGSERGLERLTNGEVMAAAVHLHYLEGEDDQSNVVAVRNAPGLHDAVVIAFARREQGILTAPGNPLALNDMRSIRSKQARMAQRPTGAGAQLLLLALLARAGMVIDDVSLLCPPCATGLDIAHAIRSGRADCGIANRAVALAAGLEFVPLIWERFDLVLRQRDYFLQTSQKLFGFLRTPAFTERAAELGGYDVRDLGEVRLIN